MVFYENPNNFWKTSTKHGDVVENPWSMEDLYKQLRRKKGLNIVFSYIIRGRQIQNPTP